jgi:hypothetical protein
MHFHADLTARRVSRILLLAFGSLLFMHLLVQFGHLVLGREWGALTELFDMDLESNLPTFFNCGLFFVGAALFYLAGKGEQELPRRPWMIMAAVFLFLGIDEGSQVHEKFMLITLRAIGWDQWHMGWLYYAWVLPYGLVVGALGLYMLRFLRRLQAGARYGLLAAGGVYLLGAVVFEAYSGKIAEAAHDTDLPGNAAYCTAITFEESLEMLGLIGCIHVMVRLLAARAVTVSVNVLPDAMPKEVSGGASQHHRTQQA